MFIDFRVSERRNLLNTVTPSDFRKNRIIRTLALVIAFIRYRFMTILVRTGIKLGLKIESFAFFDNFRFMTTESC